MTTPTMTHVRPATMGGKPMKPASAVKSSASAVKATASTVTTTSSVTTRDCRDVRHEAKRAHRDARCQNAYCFPRHGAYPISKS